nr:MFS transporter [Clostridia bacterium]
TFWVGLAFFGICSFWQIYDAIVPLLLKDAFDVGETWIGAIMAADNVLALFLLPVLGALSDRTRTRYGRRFPYIIGGTVAAAVLMQGIPMAANRISLPLFMIALGLVLLAMASYRSPAVALMPDMTPKPQRSQANAVINLMGALGGILSLGLIALLSPKGESHDYTLLFLSVGAVMLAALVIQRIKVKEPEAVLEEAGEAQHAQARLARPVRRSLLLLLASIFLWFFGYNAVTTFFSNYARQYWGLERGMFSYALMVAQGAAIVMFLPSGMLAQRIGRKRTILAGIAVLVLAFATGGLFTRFHAAILLCFALAGVGWAAINVNSLPMVVELCRGADTGRYTGYYYTASMAAQILTPILAGALIERVGYGILFPYGAAFVALSLLTLLMVRHGDVKEAA